MYEPEAEEAARILANRTARYCRLIEIGAPEVILRNERCLIRKAMAKLPEDEGFQPWGDDDDGITENFTNLINSDPEMFAMLADCALKCQQCKGAVEWIDSPTGGWWAHAVHPQDGHVAVVEGDVPDGTG